MKEKIKNRIIQIINTAKDERLLEQIYNTLDSQSNFSGNQLFGNLTDHQKKEIELSLNESENDSNLVDHKTVMNEIRAKFGWS